MINDWSYFIERSIWQIPDAFIDNIWMICIWALTNIFYFLKKRRRNGENRHFFAILFAESLFFIVYHSFLNRPFHNTCEYNLIPFWSYRTNDYRGLNLIIQNILNVFLYIPYGVFLCGMLKHPTIKNVLSIGLLTSASVELIQLVLHCGFCETDDVIHNCIGVTIGFVAFKCMKWLYKYLKK